MTRITDRKGRGWGPALTRGQGGFTLIEVLMAIILMAIFATALYTFFLGGLDAANTHQSQAKSQRTLRTAMEIFTRDVRQAVSPDDGINGGVQSLAGTTLIVHTDPNRSPAATVPRPLRVRYQLTGTTFTREVAQPVGAVPPFSYTAYSAAEPLVTDVKNTVSQPVFQAFTEQGTAMGSPVAQPRDIKVVRITLIAGQKTGQSPTTTELSTDVTLRNTSKF